MYSSISVCAQLEEGCGQATPDHNTLSCAPSGHSQRPFDVQPQLYLTSLYTYEWSTWAESRWYISQSHPLSPGDVPKKVFLNKVHVYLSQSPRGDL